MIRWEGRMAIHIRRREFIVTLSGAAASWPLAARAQQPAMLLWNSQRSGPESASRGTCHPGRDHPGMVGDIISERWARSSRNGWGASSRNHGLLAAESAN